jgi:hypothetical protein
MDLVLLNKIVVPIGISGGTQWLCDNWPFSGIVTLLDSGDIWGSLGVLATGAELYKVEVGSALTPQAAADLLTAQAQTLTRGLLFFGPIHYGSALLDFGNAAGGSSWASTTVPDLGVNASSKISVWFPSAETDDHTPQEHQIMGLLAHVHAGNIVAGVSFDILCNTSLRVRGSFQADYSRS